MVSQDQSRSANDQKTAGGLSDGPLEGDNSTADQQVLDTPNPVASGQPLGLAKLKESRASATQNPDNLEAEVGLAQADGPVLGFGTDAADYKEQGLGSTEPPQNVAPRSLARVWRQLTFVPLKNRWLNQAAHERIEAAIKLAEENHFGEIVVVIEQTLPLWRSFGLDAHTRALEVFAIQRVWDTERNSGVLIYLCLSEHALEIVVDRGLNQTIDPKYWRAVCDKTLAGIKRGEPVRALEFLIRHVGKALKLFDQSGTDPSGNELSNRVIRL